MIGPHLYGSINQHQLYVLRRWQPPVALLFNEALKGASSVRSVCPNTILIGRIWKDDKVIANDIRQDFRAAAADGAARVAEASQYAGDIDYWQYGNEELQTSPEDIHRLSQFSIAFIDKLRAMGKKAAIGYFGVAWPKAHGEDGGAAWKEFYPAMRHAKKHDGILLLHAYGKRSTGSIFNSKEWLLHKFELQSWPNLPADLKGLRYVYGEYGNDELINTQGGKHNQHGWKKPYNGNYDEFVHDMQQAAEFLADYPCLGACVFTYGFESGEWEPYDISGDCARKLSEVKWPASRWQAPAVEVAASTGAAGTQPSVAPATPTTSTTETPAPKSEAPAVDPALHRVLLQAGEEKAIPLNPGAALYKAIVRDEFMPGSPEFTIERNGDRYVGQRALQPANRRARVYYAKFGDWANVQFIE